MLQLHLASEAGRCTIVHYASSYYIYIKTSTASVTIAYTTPFVFIMHWLLKRLTIQRSNMFFGCRQQTRQSTFFKRG